MTPDTLKDLVRTVPDFPEPGIQFRDITTLVGNGPGLAATVNHLARMARDAGAEAIAGMEARGFIFGAAAAVELELPFIPVRKPGKLPVATIGVDYALEYGTDRLEIDPTSITDDQRVVIVDDLIATGGTAQAAVQLLRMAGGTVDDALFVIDLPDLGGARALHDAGVTVSALMQFEGD
ncbi:adenine phosphoribosyltransferase [Pontixanthobacter aestiaquae]|uniref:Adenine phosphoribosyltransferase n=1 Tax=Pontixanthobacter aestiaquae TaxID=1509367 RepID=A0A844Z3S9_9SPHN|nr:adenine phosphoribosyltransferase [Pontixanthobacter aestiaquae]MDN3647020.1 adenine phosphoribosyltransferase [Pontixanthobacter aestiaquae]MXO82002.1 adenine phosphoribosyltransferase [Pontixanthobacter aestiaquae]